MEKNYTEKYDVVMVEIVEMVEIKDTSDERTYDQPNFE